MNCHYCDKECITSHELSYPTYQCKPCDVHYGHNYMNIYKKVNGKSYMLQFRYYPDDNQMVLRIGNKTVLYFKKHLDITPQTIEAFINSDKVKTYILFS